MNRRGFFAGLMAALGFGAAAPLAARRERAAVAQPEHAHKWDDTPYVLVYGEGVVQRGPALRICKGCGELRVDVDQHREVVLQRAYDEAHNAVVGRARNSGFVEFVVDASGDRSVA